MLLSRLIPTVVMTGIGVHSAGAIKSRFNGAIGLSEKVVARQRIGAIVDAATLHLATGEDLQINSPAAFRTFVRRSVRIKNDRRADASIDIWGTPLRGGFTRGVLTIESAGPDRAFGTHDDISVSEPIAEY